MFLFISFGLENLEKMNKVFKDWTKRRQPKKKKTEREKNRPNILARNPDPPLSRFSLSSFFPLGRPNCPFSSFCLSTSVVGWAYHFLLFPFFTKAQTETQPPHLSEACPTHMTALSSSSSSSSSSKLSNPWLPRTKKPKTEHGGVLCLPLSIVLLPLSPHSLHVLLSLSLSLSNSQRATTAAALPLLLLS